MKKSLSLFIGLRYTRAKKRRGAISFMAFASMAGIALGVMVLVTVLSVMNGFNEKVRAEFFAIAPDVTLQGPAQSTTAWQAVMQRIEKYPNVVAQGRYVQGQGMLTVGSAVSAVYMVGIDPSSSLRRMQLGQHMIDGSLASLSQPGFQVILGESLAQSLNLSVGQSVVLLTPQLTVSPLGTLPRVKRFRVSGIFHAGGGFGFDSAVAFIGIKQAQALFAGGQSVSGIQIKTRDPYQAKYFSQQLRAQFPIPYNVSNWTDSNGSFFDALAMQKTTMFLVLALIIAVAAFNLVSSSIMLVNDKQADIAILRTIGGSPGMIMRTFIVQGCLIGLVGTLIGVGTGVLLSLHVTGVVNTLERVLHLHIINPEAFYGLSYLPSQLRAHDVLSVAAMAMGLSILATLYPAWMAFRVQPAEALRYE